MKNRQARVVLGSLLCFWAVWASSAYSAPATRPSSMDAMQVACVQFDNTPDIRENASRILRLTD